MKVQKLWSNKTISVIQTPLDHYPFAIPITTHDHPATHKKPGDKTTTFAISFEPSHHETQAADYLYTVGNDSEILLELEDAVIQLKLLLGSPHLGSLKERAESLLVSLRQLQELFELIADCQSRVSISAPYYSFITVSVYSGVCMDARLTSSW